MMVHQMRITFVSRGQGCAAEDVGIMSRLKVQEHSVKVTSLTLQLTQYKQFPLCKWRQVYSLDIGKAMK